MPHEPAANLMPSMLTGPEASETVNGAVPLVDVSNFAMSPAPQPVSALLLGSYQFCLLGSAVQTSTPFGA